VGQFQFCLLFPLPRLGCPPLRPLVACCPSQPVIGFRFSPEWWRLSAPGPVRFQARLGLCPAATPPSQRGQSFASGKRHEIGAGRLWGYLIEPSGGPLSEISPLQTVGNQSGPSPTSALLPPPSRYEAYEGLRWTAYDVHQRCPASFPTLRSRRITRQRALVIAGGHLRTVFLRSSLLRCRSPGKKGMTRRGNRKVKGNQFRPLLVGIASNSDALAIRACHRHTTTTTTTTCTTWYNARPHCCSLGGSRKLVCRSAGRRRRPLVRIGRLARPENRCCGFAIRSESLSGAHWAGAYITLRRHHGRKDPAM